MQELDEFSAFAMHWQYAKYVFRHKWYVLKECWKYGLYWRGLVHDLSKFSRAEWDAYAMSFYGPWEYDERPEWLVAMFDRAWLHHQHVNSHHPQHWVLREDSGNVKVLEMPWEDRVEMIADWRGAGKAQGNPDTRGWYLKNREKILLGPETRAWVEVVLNVMPEDIVREAVPEAFVGL